MPISREAGELAAVGVRLAVIAAVALGVWRVAVTVGLGPTVRRLFFVRHQAVFALALMLAPLVFLGPARAMLGNAFVLTRPLEVWWVTFLTVSAAWVVMSTWYIALAYADARFPDSSAEPMATAADALVATPNRRIAFTAVLAAPLVVGVLLSSAQRDAVHPGAATMVAAAAWLVRAGGPLLVLAAIAGIMAAGLQLYANAVLRDVFDLGARRDAHFALYRDVPNSALGGAARWMDGRLFGGRFGAGWRRLSRGLVGALRALAHPVRPAQLADGLGRLAARAAWLERLGPGYFTAPDPSGDEPNGTNDRRVLPGHAFALVQIALLVALYAFVFWVYRPNGAASELFPVLAFMLILFMILAYVLSATAFLLDRWRVSSVLSAGSVILVLWFVARSDHYFRLEAYEPAVGGAHDLGPAEAVHAWYDPDDPACAAAPAMVAVATSGGGIRAAVWTAEVLTGLEEMFGAPFSRSLSVVSSVSGGSVGAVHYLLGFPACRARDAEALAEVRAAASASSMGNMAWGFVYPDLFRLACAPCMEWLPSFRLWDRARAMEREWAKHVVGAAPDTTLADWRPGIRSGVRPVALINATTVDSGHTFVFSPVDLRSEGAFDGFATFFDEYAAHDVQVLTAARLSATFPWVSPVARPLWSGPPEVGEGGRYRTFHLADGGYVDNFGIATVIEWLGASLAAYADAADATAARPARVLLIQVRDSEHSHVDHALPSGSDGWSFAALGPVQTVVKARGATQVMRNDQEVRLFRGIQDIRAWRDALSGAAAPPPPSAASEAEAPDASRAVVKPDGTAGVPGAPDSQSTPLAASAEQAKESAMLEQLARAARSAVVSDAPPTVAGGGRPVVVQSVPLELPSGVSNQVSLSWKLTEVEQARLRGAWCGLVAAWRPGTPGPIEEVRAFLGVGAADVVIPTVCRESLAGTAGGERR